MCIVVKYIERPFSEFLSTYPLEFDYYCTLVEFKRDSIHNLEKLNGLVSLCNGSIV